MYDPHKGEVINIFIGYDPAETVAYYTLAHSIMRRASKPVSITPIMKTQLGNVFTRERGEKESTEFSISRFLVPYLCNYQGFAIFMDCDILCRGDIAELWDMIDHSCAIQCVQHDYVPKESTKMLGQEQTKYKYKNWTSVMIFNNKKCRELTSEYVNTAHGLDLHQFKWLPEDRKIGALPHDWNHLVGVDAPNSNANLIHFTLGGPWWDNYQDVEYADEWHQEHRLMIHAEQSLAPKLEIVK